jgi:HEAT repeat protein
LLSHKDSGIRYWAATGLTVLGGAAEPAAPALRKALSDPSPNVRFASAEALCRLDDEAAALPVLVAGLKAKEPHVQLAAAISLVHVGSDAQPVTPQLEATLSQTPEKWLFPMLVRWALEQSLRQAND